MNEVEKNVDEECLIMLRCLLTNQGGMWLFWRDYFFFST